MPPYCRRYETFEVRRLLQAAEGSASPVTGVGAHSRGLHSRRTPGGIGVDQDEMLDRTHKRPGESNNQFKQRGGAVRTSTFANLLQQADVACQALNSAIGQQALAILDQPANRARRVRLTLEAAGVAEAGFIAGSPAPSMGTVHKNDAAVLRPAGGAAGVRLIIDCAPNQPEIHIQTCFPLSGAVQAGFEVKDMTTNTVVAQG